MTPLMEPPENQDILLYGATGDLASHRLWPALYNLYQSRSLPLEGKIIAIALDDLTREAFLKKAQQFIESSDQVTFSVEIFTEFSKRVEYHPINGSLVSYLTKNCLSPTRVVYLATPPSAFESILYSLKDANIANNAALVIEKPFGHNLLSAQILNRILHELTPESNIFRIDHYLGKETVQNLLVTRFGNSMLQYIWNRQAVENVQITVAEYEGVQNRGHLYNESGAIRDVVQNHLFQLLALTCLTPPASWSAEALRDEKVKILRAIRPIHPEDVVLGQYISGKVGENIIPAYKDTYGVNNDTTVETYAALRCYVDTWEWAGVPFYLRTGKAMGVKRTEIVLTFRDVPLHFFEETQIGRASRNRLTVRIQPREGMSFSFNVKTPGEQIIEHPAKMDFSYDNIFPTRSKEAYERLLRDVLYRDHTLFIREDETEAAWEALDPLLQNMPGVHYYSAGTSGPREAEILFQHWHNLTHHYRK